MMILTRCITHGGVLGVHDNSSGRCQWVDVYFALSTWGFVKVGDTVWHAEGMWKVTTIGVWSDITRKVFGLDHGPGTEVRRPVRLDTEVLVIRDPDPPRPEVHVLSDRWPLTVRSLIMELLDLDTGLDALVYIGKGCGPLSTITETVSDSPCLVLSSGVLPDD